MPDQIEELSDVGPTGLHGRPGVAYEIESFEGLEDRKAADELGEQLFVVVDAVKAGAVRVDDDRGRANVDALWISKNDPRRGRAVRDGCGKDRDEPTRPDVRLAPVELCLGEVGKRRLAEFGDARCLPGRDRDQRVATLKDPRLH